MLYVSCQTQAAGGLVCGSGFHEISPLEILDRVHDILKAVTKSPRGILCGSRDFQAIHGLKLGLDLRRS